MTIEDFQKLTFDMMDAKGFHADRPNNTRDDQLVRLALIHTEVSEATQEVKRHWTANPSPELKAKIMDELADIVIRVADMAGCLGMSLQEACLKKSAFNNQRPKNYGTPKEEKTPAGG